MSDSQTDKHLLELLHKYDTWVNGGQLAYVGRILPVREALPVVDWVVPTGQALDILRNASVLALADCTCRSHYGRCSHPRDTCLLVDTMAEAFLAQGKARAISLEKATEVLRKANRHGLVHQAVHDPIHRVWAVCSCCPCCCYRLQVLQVFGRDDLVVHSDYIAVADDCHCCSCGRCVERCLFGARQFEDGIVVYEAERCYGCGLCVATCTERAITLKRRSGPRENGAPQRCVEG